MPLYEYKCPNCETITTKLRKMKNRDKKVLCKKCQTICKRTVSMPFYKDDTASWKPQNRPDMKDIEAVKKKKFKI